MKTKFGLKVISNYFSWFLEQYHKYNKNTYLFKIVGKERCQKTNEEKLIIQVSGKNIFPRFSPKELLENEKTLRGFSPLDVRTITYLACKEENQNNLKQSENQTKRQSIFRIFTQSFSKINKKEMIVLENIKENKFITKSAQDLTRNKSILANMDPIESNRVGYIAGQEEAVDIINIRKKP